MHIALSWALGEDCRVNVKLSYNQPIVACRIAEEYVVKLNFDTKGLLFFVFLSFYRGTEKCTLHNKFRKKNSF